MKSNNFAKGLLLSIVSLAGGFVAIAIPFGIFNTMSTTGVKILFACEIALYLATGLIFLLVQDKKNKQKAIDAKKHEQRQLKVKECVDNWYNIAA